MEASLENIRSIGFSLDDYSFDADFEPAKPWVRQVMQHTLNRPFQPGTLLNVNFPKLPADQIRGLRLCRQADDRWVEKFQEGRDPHGQPYYWLGGTYVNLDEGGDTDVQAVKNGYVAVVPAMHDLTNYRAMDGLKDLESDAFHH